MLTLLLFTRRLAHMGRSERGRKHLFLFSANVKSKSEETLQLRPLKINCVRSIELKGKTFKENVKSKDNSADWLNKVQVSLVFRHKKPKTTKQGVNSQSRRVVTLVFVSCCLPLFALVSPWGEED